MREQEVRNVYLTSRVAPGVDFGKHNRPVCKEVVPILLDDIIGAK